MSKSFGKLAVSDTLLWLLVILFLLPVVFFPISTDLAIYAQAGKTIFNGGKIYVDFIDIKQPLIYYIFSVFYFLSNNSEIGYRLIDFSYQMITVVFLFRLIRKYSDSKPMAYAVILFYSISYSVLNYNQTMQPESFLGLPLIFIINYILSSDRSMFTSLITGIVLGIVSGIKFSFIIAILGLFFNDLLISKNLKQQMKSSYPILITGLAAGFALSCLPLLNPQIMHGYRLTYSYMAFYMSRPPFSAADISYSIKHLAYFWGDNFSVSLLFFVVIGIYSVIKADGPNRTGGVALLMFIIYFAGVIAERKFYPYHFVRMYVPLMILAGYGFKELIGPVKNLWKQKKKFELAALTALCLFLLPLSPFPRYINLCHGVIAYFHGEKSFEEYYSGKSNSLNCRKEQKELAGIINRNVTQNDTVTVLSASDYSINFFLKNVHLSRLALSCFYFNPETPQEWKRIFLQDLLRSEWVVIQTNDWNYHVYGDYKTAFQKALADNEVAYILQNYFVKFNNASSYVVFQKIKNKKAS